MIRMKRYLMGTLSLGLIMGMVLSAAPKVDAAKKVKIDKVAVNAPSGKTAYVAKGRSVRLTVNVKTKSKKKSDKKVTYKSANSKVASVNGKGVVKGIKAGKTKVTVTSSKNTKKKATINIVVKNAAVKSVKLKEKSAVLSVGEKKTLEATVMPKKASNKIEWSSSKSSVASVSDKGVVTGKMAGNAVITAKATDGSGKKATVKVTVTDEVNMVAMSVQNVQTVTFSLDKAQALTADNIFVKTKTYAGGAYKNQLKIDNVSTTDNRNYSVVLNNDTRIFVNEIVQVSVPSLTGKVKSMEKEYTEQLCAFMDEEISAWTVDEYGSDNFTFGNAYGHSSYMVTGLPAGLEAELVGDCMYVKGTPATVGSTTATLSAVDERGNTLTKSIYFIVGSEDVIAGAAIPGYSLIAAPDDDEVGTCARFAGGTNSYKYEIIDDGGTGAEIMDEDNRTVYISTRTTNPGEYNVKVRAVDGRNRTCDVVVPIHISQGITVTGTIKDASGNPMPSASIRFMNKNRADRFFREGSFYMDKNGSYSATISAGTYDISASYSNNGMPESDSAKATSNLYKQELSGGRSGLDISLPVYKVTLVSADPVKYPLVSWHEGYSQYNYKWYIKNEFAGAGDTLYLKNGSYTIESGKVIGDNTINETGDWFHGTVTTDTYTVYRLVGNVVVNGAAAQVSVSRPAEFKTVTRTDIGTAAKDTPYEANVGDKLHLDHAGKYNAYSFTPEKTDRYTFLSGSVKFYDMTGKVVDSTEMYGLKVYELVQGTKYIVSAGDNDISEDLFEIQVYEDPKP